ncbi:hypothetical protein BH10ACT11_BH10ACT11_05640 [soil metagenome]
MKVGIGESRRRRIIAAIGISVVSCLFVAAPALAGKPPSVDEYTLNFPHPGGDGGSNGGGKGSGGSGNDASALDPGVRAQLSDSGDASLIAIATDPALGAIGSAKANPSARSGKDSSNSGSGAASGSGAGLNDERGVLAAATSALGGGSLPWLGLGLLATVVGTFVARRRSSAG